MQDRTKQRVQQASAIATEMFGEGVVKQSPSIISAIMLSMTVDELGDKITKETDKLTDIITRSVAHIAN